MDPRIIKAANKYDAELRRIGKVVRVAPYINSSTPIDHQCIRHGYTFSARPSGLLRGQGLQCCLDDARKEEGRRRREFAADKYDSALSEIGKLKRLEPYISALTPIRHQCLVHGLIKPITPNNALRGKGLRCCQYAALKEANFRKSQEAMTSYDTELAKHGILERIEPYVDAVTPILHRCLRHHHDGLQIPSHARRGRGLECCRNASICEVANKRRGEAAKLYDRRIASFERIQRIDEYQGRGIKIKHRCLIHGEEHLIDPTNALRGDGLECCNAGAGWDSLQRVIEGRSLKAEGTPCHVYIYRVKGCEHWFKIGIAVNPSLRAKQPASFGLYGEFVASWILDNRRDAILVETAILRDQSFMLPDATLATLRTKAGFTEVRGADLDELIWFTGFLVSRIQEDPEMHWAQWALDHIPALRKWEIHRLRYLAHAAN